MRDYDVIVIGGGFAGVTAAREIGLSRLRCLLLEARGRLGGRTWYDKLAGHGVELGGTWIHWLQPHVWAEVTRYGLTVVESPGVAAPGTSAWIVQGQRKTGSPEEIFGLITDGVTRFCHDGQALLPRPYDPLFNSAIADLDGLSIQDRLDQLDMADEQREILAGFWSSACLAPCAESGLTVMLRWWALGQWSFPLMMDAVAHYKLEQGTTSLIEAMVEDGSPKVQLSAAVKRIHQEAGGVVVETQAGEQFSAAAVVIAVPLNVLDQIEFTPALSTGKRAAASERHAGRGLKVQALVRRVPADFFGAGSESEALTFLSSEREVADGVIMVGFGPDASRLDVTDAAAVQQAIRRFLPDAEVVAVRGHDWTSDPFARGVHSVFRPGQLTRYLQELQRAEGRLIFAGSDIASGWNGFIDGAVETGLRAGRDALRMARSS
jgi:monoamine oxidase